MPSETAPGETAATDRCAAVNPAGWGHSLQNVCVHERFRPKRTCCEEILQRPLSSGVDSGFCETPEVTGLCQENLCNNPLAVGPSALIKRAASFYDEHLTIRYLLIYIIY